MMFAGAKKKDIIKFKNTVQRTLTKLKQRYIKTPAIDPEQQIKELEALDKAFGAASPWKIHEEK